VADNPADQYYYPWHIEAMQLIRTMAINQQNALLSLCFFMCQSIKVVYDPFKGKLAVSPAIRGTSNPM